jgi:hypothetical protein
MLVDVSPFTTWCVVPERRQVRQKTHLGNERVAASHYGLSGRGSFVAYLPPRDVNLVVPKARRLHAVSGKFLGRLVAQRMIKMIVRIVAGASGLVAILQLRRRGSCAYRPWLPSR